MKTTLSVIFTVMFVFSGNAVAKEKRAPPKPKPVIQWHCATLSADQEGDVANLDEIKERALKALPANKQPVQKDEWQLIFSEGKYLFCIWIKMIPLD